MAQPGQSNWGRWWGLFVPLLSCQSATQIEVVLSTDLPCDQVSMTSVTVGRPEKLEGKFPSMSTTMCEPGSKSLGSITLVPSGEADEEFAIRIVTGTTGVSPDDCIRDGNKGCIIARRSLRYLPNRKLFLPIPMYAECKGVYCEPGTTCHRAGVCRPASIENPELCTTSGACSPDALRSEETADSSAGSAGTQGVAGVGGAGMGGMSGAGTGGAGSGDEAGMGGTSGAGMGGAGGVGGAGTGGADVGGASGNAGVGGFAGNNGSSGNGAEAGAGGSGAGASGAGGGSAGSGGSGGAPTINGIGAWDANVEQSLPACTIVEIQGYPLICYNPTGAPTEPGLKFNIEVTDPGSGGVVARTFSAPNSLRFGALYDIAPSDILKVAIEFPPGAPASCLANTEVFTSPSPTSLPAPGVVRFSSGASWGGVDFPRFPPPNGPYITTTSIGTNDYSCNSYALYLFSN